MKSGTDVGSCQHHTKKVIYFGWSREIHSLPWRHKTVVRSVYVTVVKALKGFLQMFFWPSREPNKMDSQQQILQK